MSVRRPKPKMGTEREVVARRIAAFLIDMIVVGAILGAFAIAGVLLLIPVLALALVEDPILAIDLDWIILISLTASAGWFPYSFLLEGFAGQTLGKKAMGIVVVKTDGSPCTYLASFERNLLRVIDGMGYYLIGLMVMLLSKRRQRIGDHVAETVVVKACRGVA